MSNVEDLFAAFPMILEPEFVMANPDEPIFLARERLEVLRDGQPIGHIEGEITLEWIPDLRIICRGESDISPAELLKNNPLRFHAPRLGLTTDAIVTNWKMGQKEIQAHLLGENNPNLQNIQKLRFYLVNFPPFLGEHVRTVTGSSTGASCDRLTMETGGLVCTIDRIQRAEHPGMAKGEPKYLLTHIAEIENRDAPITPLELQEMIDVLHWLFTFMRGARTGPVLPSAGSPFIEHWFSISPWRVNEPRCVNSWMPRHSGINANSLFKGFVEKWRDPVWNEGLRTTIAWYIAANAPSTTNEARITLCQIALEVLASIHGLEDKPACKRIRILLRSLRIPTRIPERLEALYEYANRHGVDAPECLTRIRNKLEHPSTRNLQQIREISGITRMQAAQYGIEVFELCLLATMNYQGKYVRRAFQGWRGDDEVLVPWAIEDRPI